MLEVLWSTSINTILIYSIWYISRSKNVGMELSNVVFDENKKDWRKLLQTEEKKMIRSELGRYLEAGCEEGVPNCDILN